MSNALHRESVIKLGTNRNNPRIWIEGQWLTDYGFAPGTKFKLTYEKGRVVITPDNDGDRTVSARGKSRPGAIIDINTSKLLDVFKAGTSLHVVAEGKQITITPAKSAIKRAARVLTRTAISLFAGGGLLDKAASNAGFKTVAAVEVNPTYAEVWEMNHTGSMHEMPIEEVDFTEMAKRLDQPLGLLIAGRPCQPYSNIRRLDRGGQTKRDKTLPPEAHELGHLDYYMLAAIDALNPHTVVIENVTGYLKAGSSYMVQGVLRAMGYPLVEAREFNSRDFKNLQARKRSVIVASTFDAITWPSSVVNTATFSQIMDKIPDDSDLWFGMDHWAPKHWAKQSAKGNGFAAPAITAASDQVPTLKSRYYAGQGDNFVVAHPKRPNTWRWLTLNEGRRLMGLPTNYNLGTTKTAAGEILGQGVVVPMFEKLIASITGSTATARTA